MRALEPSIAGTPRRVDLAWVDAAVHAAARAARILPALVSPDAGRERAKAVAALTTGGAYEPPRPGRGPKVDGAAYRALSMARAQVRDVAPPALAGLYLGRIDELELELDVLGALGHGARVRDLSRRRWGTGETVVLGRRLRAVANEMLETLVPDSEERSVPAEGPGSVAEAMRTVALRAGLDIEVRIDARLVAGAATGDRVVFLAPRLFGRRELRRLAAHEVLGHAVAAANAAQQPLRLLEAGTAGAFGDQEGLSIVLERGSGAFDASRARTLAARVVACDLVHRGASFVETARHLRHDRGFEAEAAVALAERVHRGGGVTRDVAYLDGWLRVEAAIARGEASIDELRRGRVGLSAIAPLRELEASGHVAAPALTPDGHAALSGVGAVA